MTTLTNAYDFIFDDFLLCDGVTRSLITAKIFDNPDIRTSDSDRGSIDGQYPGTDLYGSRTIELDIEIWGEDATFGPSLQALQAAVRKRDTEKVLSFRLPGYPDLRMYCKPRRVSGARVDVQMDMKVTTMKVQFKSTDPRIYHEALQSGIAYLPPLTIGAAFPLDFPIDFGGIPQSNLIQATNDGWYEAPWKATINGPVTNPRIEHVQSEKVLAFTGEVPAGQTLVVYSRPDSMVLLNGTSSRYGWLDDPSQWFMLAPGQNEVKLTGSSAGAPFMVLEWRSAIV